MAMVAPDSLAAATHPGRCDAWRTLLDSVSEVDCEAEVVGGALPAELVGVLYRNGPGRRDFAKSFFDGDGMIRALTLRGDGRARFRSRFVRTRKFLKERGRSRPRFRMAGTDLPGGALANALRPPAHSANTNAVWHAGRLLACEEGGKPFDIDPADLSTRRKESFGGGLPRMAAFSAHPHLDAATDSLVNFGVNFGGPKAVLRTFRLDAGGRLQNHASFDLPYVSLLHDYGLSPNWMTFFLPPAPISLPRVLLGLDNFFGGMRWRPELGGRAILMPRSGGEPLVLPMEPFIAAHFVGAWEEGDEVVVDLCAYDDWDALRDSFLSPQGADFAGYGQGSVRRIRIQTKTKEIRSEELCGLPCEFPRIDSRRETQRGRYAYFAANRRRGEGGMHRALLRLERESGRTQLHDYGERKVALEPVFAARPGATAEDDGWVLQQVHDGERDRTEFAVFDARSVADGPVCTLRLPCNQGLTFHGSWAPG